MWYDEIDAARLKTGEDEALEVEARRLSHAGTLGEQARQLGGLLDGRGRRSAPVPR